MPSVGFATTRFSLWKWCRLRGAGLEIERLTAPKAQCVPIDHTRFWEVDKVKHALRVEVSTGIFRAGENEPTTANLTQAFTGLLGHGVISS